MKLVLLADLHGRLPEKLPESDVVVIAGDICGGMGGEHGQYEFLDGPFREWLKGLPTKRVVATWGNHDWIGASTRKAPHDLPWHMLVDEGVTIDGVNFWGSPWQPWFHDWAFNATEEDLARHFSKIPDNTDVLVVHGPPHGYGDMVKGGHNVGSRSLTAAIRRVKPALVVTGHIHEAYGEYALDGTIIVNAAQVDHNYRRTRAAVEWELERASD